MNLITFKIFTPVMVLENMRLKTQQTLSGNRDSDYYWHASTVNMLKRKKNIKTTNVLH